MKELGMFYGYIQNGDSYIPSNNDVNQFIDQLRRENMEEKKIVKILEPDDNGAICDDGNFYLWPELEINEDNMTAAVKPKPAPKLIKFKCKPTYNFQSIEFEIEVTEDYLEPMFQLYRRVVEGLIRVTPEQPKPGQPMGKPASPKQMEIMDKFHISYQPGITYDQADKLIQESYQRAKNSRTY